MSRNLNPDVFSDHGSVADHGEAKDTVEQTTKMEPLSALILDQRIKEIDKLLMEAKSLLAGLRSYFVSPSPSEEEGRIGVVISASVADHGREANGTVEETMKIEALSALNSCERKKEDEEVLLGAVIPGHAAAKSVVEEMTKLESSLAELVEERKRYGDDALEGGEEEIKDKEEVTDEVQGDESSEEEEEDHGESSEEEEEVDYGHLCTITCDFLCGLKALPNKSFDRDISRKVMPGLRNCCKDDSSELREDTIVTDIRGRYVLDALEAMAFHLHCWSRQPKFKTLLVTVGCKVHGCGEGLLYRAVTRRLKLDESIAFEELHNGAVISIPLNGREDYSILGYSWQPI